MRSKKTVDRKPEPPCMVCNPENAEQGEYCPMHLDQLEHLDLQCENLFRFQRISRGKGHESYNIYLQGDADSCGKVLASETDLAATAGLYERTDLIVRHVMLILMRTESIKSIEIRTFETAFDVKPVAFSVNPRNITLNTKA